MDAWILADRDELADRIRDSLLHLAVECPTTRVARIESINAPSETVAGFDGLVFFAAHHLEPSSFELLRQIRAAVDDHAKVVVISSIDDHGTVLNTIRAGAGDFLSADDNLHEELVSFVTRVKAERWQKHVNGRVVSIVPCHAPSDASLMASNLAAVIAKRAGSCGLLDFHLRGGDLALLLKLSPRHTIVDLLNQQVTIDEAIFEQALTLHESGIRLLAGPSSFVELKNVRSQVCQQIIDLARRSHPFVIANAEDVQHAEQIRALGESDEVILTMRLDIVSLHRAKQHIEFMTHNRVPRENIHVVALGVGYAGELPVSAAKKVLQLSTLHTIPDDPVSMLRSVNVGNPLVLESPRAKISRAIIAFVETLVEATESSTQSSQRPSMAAMKAAAAVALNTLSFGK